MIIFWAGIIDKFWLKYALSCEKALSRNAISVPSYITGRWRGRKSGVLRDAALLHGG